MAWQIELAKDGATTWPSSTSIQSFDPDKLSIGVKCIVELVDALRIDIFIVIINTMTLTLQQRPFAKTMKRRWPRDQVNSNR